MQKTFSKQYFLCCKACFEKKGQENFVSEEKLNQMLYAIEETFCEERLYVFVLLLEKCYNKNVISEKKYFSCIERLKRIEKQMLDNKKNKVLQAKKIYGFCMIQGENLEYKIDGNAETIYRMLDEAVMGGKIVSPIYAKDYDWGYNVKIQEIKNDFRQILCQIFNQEYMDVLKEIYEKNVYSDRVHCDMNEEERISFAWIKNRYQIKGEQ